MMMKKIGSIVMLGCAMTLGTRVMRAQNPGDKAFLMTAGQTDLAEIKLAHLALTKTRNPAVRAFANQMIKDHMKLTADTKPFAKKNGVPPAKLLSTAQQQEYAELSKLSGKSFDKAYISGAVKDHHEALDLFSKEEASTSDSDLKNTVTAGKGVVSNHTQMSEELSSKLGE